MVVLMIKMKAFDSLVMCECVCVFLVHLQIFGLAFTCRIIIQMVLVVVFSHQIFLRFLPQMSIHMYVARQPCLVPRSQWNTHCESMLYNTCPFCCQGGSDVCVYVYVHVCVCASDLYQLPTLWPQQHAKFHINALSVNVTRHCVCWQGSQFPAQHANCVLNVQNQSFLGKKDTNLHILSVIADVLTKFSSS